MGTPGTRRSPRGQAFSGFRAAVAKQNVVFEPIADRPVAAKACGSPKASAMCDALGALIRRSNQHLQGLVRHRAGGPSGCGVQGLPRNALTAHTCANPIASAQAPFFITESQTAEEFVVRFAAEC